MSRSSKVSLAQEIVGVLLLFISLGLAVYFFPFSYDMWSFLITAVASAVAVVCAFLRWRSLSTSIIISSILTNVLVFLFQPEVLQMTALVVIGITLLILTGHYVYRHFINQRASSNT